MKTLSPFGLLIFLLLSNSGKTQNTLKPGDIAPDAKYIDANILNPFSCAAIIQKGNSTAMIDRGGNIIVPFNRYRFYPTYGSGGFFTATDQNSGGGASLVNDKGETIFRGTFFDQGGGIAIIRENKGGVSSDAFVDNHGNKYPVRYEGGMKIEKVTDDIAYRSHQVLLQQQARYVITHSYAALNGKLLTTQVFDETNPFQDGMALVGKADEFGKMKYGFLNKQGILSVPLQYSIKPSNFQNGFAKVTPTTGQDFAFAFINQKGDIKIKVTNEMNARLKFSTVSYLSPDILRCGIFCEFFGQGAQLSNAYFVMDTAGRIIALRDFIEANNSTHVAISNNTTVFVRKGTDKQYYFVGIQSKREKTPRFFQDGFGYINTDKKIIIPPIFEGPLDFDPITRLACAKLFIAAGSNGQPDVYREGYINEDGVFVIVKKENISTF